MEVKGSGLNVLPALKKYLHSIIYDENYYVEPVHDFDIKAKNIARCWKRKCIK